MLCGSSKGGYSRQLPGATDATWASLMSLTNVGYCDTVASPIEITQPQYIQILPIQYACKFLHFFRHIFFFNISTCFLWLIPQKATLDFFPSSSNEEVPRSLPVKCLTRATNWGILLPLGLTNQPTRNPMEKRYKNRVMKSVPSESEKIS